MQKITILNLIIMKKSVLFIVIVTLSMNVFGQKEGERYVSPYLSASFGLTNYRYFQNGGSYHNTEWSNVYISPGVEFGKFLTDNLRFGFSIGNPFSYFVEDNSAMLGTLVSTNLGFYVPITDRFSYAPEVGLGGELGLYNGHWYYKAMAYTNLLVFDFRVKENVSIAMHMGEIGYCFSKVFNSSGYANQFYYNFNSGMISVRFYY